MMSDIHANAIVYKVRTVYARVLNIVRNNYELKSKHDNGSC
jgi:hypothetical protein